MKRLAVAIAMLAMGAAGCGTNNTPTTPTSTPTVFTVNMTAAAETPPVTGPESTGQGVAVITLNTTKDASGTITAATMDFNVTMSGFPNGSSAIMAHIHPGALGVKGGILIDSTLAQGPAIQMPNGTGSFSLTKIAVTADKVNQILAAPQNFYFNVHTPLNPGGAIRGQLK